MKINDIITLSSGDNYLLLELINYEDNSYFFSVKVNKEKNKAIGVYNFIKVITDDKKSKALIVKDKNIKQALYNLLAEQM